MKFGSVDDVPNPNAPKPITRSDGFRPMLAGKVDLTKLAYPVLVSPKLDGVRALVKDGVLLSRSLKPIPNKALQARFGVRELEGYDGELIVGRPTDVDVYNKTIREVMTIDGPDTATFHIFDVHNEPDVAYTVRATCPAVQERVTPVPQSYVGNEETLLQAEAALVAFGFEGAMIRKPDGLYKYGRSTTNEGWLLKLKRFEDSEAVVIGMEELMQNNNPATRSELGLTKRASDQENKVGLGTMGALIVRDLKSGVDFNVGTGFTAADRVWWWSRGYHERADIIKYKYFPVGVKDKPRHPVYIGLRNAGDM